MFACQLDAGLVSDDMSVPNANKFRTSGLKVYSLLPSKTAEAKKTMQPIQSKACTAGLFAKE